jgi:predicted nucleotidyltransferase
MGGEPFHCMRRAVEGDPVLRAKVFSLVAFGSYVRGDFKPGISDLDLLAVLREDYTAVAERLLVAVKRCAEEMDIILVDMPWMTIEQLRDPIGSGYGFKFLTFYQADFLAHHRVVHGAEIAHLIPLYTPEELAVWRARRLLENIERFKGRPDMLRVSAGEAAKFLAVVHGVESIRKDTVLKALRELGDEEAYTIYREYVDGVDAHRGTDYYAGFISSRMKAYLEEHGEATDPRSNR